MSDSSVHPTDRPLRPTEIVQAINEAGKSEAQKESVEEGAEPLPVEVVPDFSFVTDHDQDLDKETSFYSPFQEKTWTEKLEDEKVNEVRSHLTHKSFWSIGLILLMTWMVAFQSFLLWYVGLGVLDFSEYDWLLPALLVQNLAQIIGLCTFVVKSLFKSIETDAKNEMHEGSSKRAG